MSSRSRTDHSIVENHRAQHGSSTVAAVVSGAGVVSGPDIRLSLNEATNNDATVRSRDGDGSGHHDPPTKGEGEGDSGAAAARGDATRSETPVEAEQGRLTAGAQKKQGNSQSPIILGSPNEKTESEYGERQATVPRTESAPSAQEGKGAEAVGDTPMSRTGECREPTPASTP